MRKSLPFLLAICLLPAVAAGQPRPPETTNSAPTRPLPEFVEARYEGGIFGNSRKETGSLKMDNENERLVFFGKDKKEMFAIPYSALLVIYPDSKVSTSTTGNVVSRLPLPGAGLAGLITKSTKYLIIRYDDQEVDVEGTANFKFEDRDVLVSFIHALGTTAKMKQRGEAYYRAKKATF
jgi:hypothetical protein